MIDDNKPQTARPTDAGCSGDSRCPKCNGTAIGGLMSAFWVPLKTDGVTVDGDWNEWSSESELSTKRICYDCDHEFEF